MLQINAYTEPLGMWGSKNICLHMSKPFKTICTDDPIIFRIDEHFLNNCNILALFGTCPHFGLNAEREEMRG
jgi:hypothetical protein